MRVWITRELVFLAGEKQKILYFVLHSKLLVICLDSFEAGFDGINNIVGGGCACGETASCFVFKPCGV